MRKLAIVMALASTALASPALARDKSWYVGVDAGAMLIEDIKFDIGIQKAASADHATGWDVDGNIGYDFGAFRVEAEVGYRRATPTRYTNQLRTPFYTGTGALTTLAPGTYQIAGRSAALSFMVNGLLDFGDDDHIQGFVGGGVGVARVRERLRDSNVAAFLSDTDTKFAYQGIAGVRAPLGPHLDASIKYRFFDVGGARVIDVTNQPYTYRFRSHSILAGLAYNFGEPAAPPPPPPPSAPPPPPPPPPRRPRRPRCVRRVRSSFSSSGTSRMSRPRPLRSSTTPCRNIRIAAMRR